MRKKISVGLVGVRRRNGLTRASKTSLLTLLLLASVLSSSAPAQIQIVNCADPVQSRKRGIPANSLSAADFRAPLRERLRLLYAARIEINSYSLARFGTREGIDAHESIAF